MDYYTGLTLLYIGMSLVTLYWFTLKEALHDKVVVKVRARDCFDEDGYRLKGTDGRLQPLYSDLIGWWSWKVDVLVIMFLPVIFLVDILEICDKIQYRRWIVVLYVLSFFLPSIRSVLSMVHVSISFG